LEVAAVRGEHRDPSLHGSNDLSLAKARDGLGAVPELTEDGVGVLAEGGRAMAKAAGRLREIDGHRREWRGAGQPRILRVVQQAGGTDVRVLERLLRGVERAGGDLRGLQLGERLRGRALAGPLVHALGDDLAVVPAREVIAKARIGEPVL